MSGECNICGKWGCVESNHKKRRNKMIPKTIKELFDQIQIDANNQIIFNRKLYEDWANKIVESLLKQQREICLKNADISFMETDGGYHVYINRLSILNAPEPTGEK